jgi:hypothetical protein
MKEGKLSALILKLIICCLPVCQGNATRAEDSGRIHNFSDRNGTIGLTLDCNGRCVVTNLRTAGKEIL